MSLFSSSLPVPRRTVIVAVSALLAATLLLPTVFAQESTSTTDTSVTETTDPNTQTEDTTPDEDETGNVTIVQALVGTTVDFYVNADYDDPLASDATFGDVTLAELAPGTYSVEVYAADADPSTTDPLIGPATLSVTDTSIHSVVAGLSATGANELFFFVDDLSATSGQTRVVVRHVANTDALEVRLDGSAVSSQLEHGNAVATVVPAADTEIEFALSSDSANTILPARTLQLEADHVVTVYAAGSTDPSEDNFDIVAVVAPAAATDTSTTSTPDSTTTTVDDPSGVPTGDGSSLGGDGLVVLVAAAALVAAVSSAALLRGRRLG